MKFEVPETARQSTVLALARLSIERPGWHNHLRETAGLFWGEEMFDQFLGLLQSEEGTALNGPKLTACQFFAEFERVRARLQRVVDCIDVLRVESHPLGSALGVEHAVDTITEAMEADDQPTILPELQPKTESPF